MGIKEVNKFYFLYIYFQDRTKIELVFLIPIIMITVQSASINTNQKDFTTQTPNKKDAIEVDEGMSEARPVHPG